MTTREMQKEIENRLYVLDPVYRMRKLYSREVLNYIHRAYNQIIDTLIADAKAGNYQDENLQSISLQVLESTATIANPLRYYAVLPDYAVLPAGLDTDLITSVSIHVVSSYTSYPNPTDTYIRGIIKPVGSQTDNMVLDDDQARIITEPYVWVADGKIWLQVDRYTDVDSITVSYYTREDNLWLSLTPCTPGLSKASHMRIVELAYQLIVAERYGSKQQKGDKS